MSNEDGCLKAGFLLFLFNAGLVGACHLIKLMAPVIPYLALGVVIVLVLIGIVRASTPQARSTPPPPPEFTFERAEFRLDRPAPEMTFVDEPPPPVGTARCLVCRIELAEDIVTCRRCRTPHHRACFRYARQCAVFACGGRTWTREPRLPRTVRWDPAFRAQLRDFCRALVPEIRRHGGRCVHCGRVSRRFRLVDNGVSLPHFRCTARGCGRRSAPEIVMTPEWRQGLLDFDRTRMTA